MMEQLWGAAILLEPSRASAALATLAVLLGSAGFSLLLLRGDRRSLWTGCLACLLGFLALLGVIQPWLGGFWGTMTFWGLAGVTIIAAAATVASRNPIYSAISFAVSLLGTGGLFLLEGAQFLGVATVVVYAGAIVVTFLFLLMLAQPDGDAFYDRVSWGGIPVVLAVVTGVTLMGLIAFAAGAMTAGEGAGAAAAGNGAALFGPQHVALLGGQLFGRHLIAVEVAATLLLVALVGAIAITLQGRASTMGAVRREHADE